MEEATKSLKSMFGLHESFNISESDRNCIKAESIADSMRYLASNWTEKLQNVEKTKIGFKAASIYIDIADKFSRSYNKSIKLNENIKIVESDMKQLNENYETLNSESNSLLSKINNQIARISSLKPNFGSLYQKSLTIDLKLKQNLNNSLNNVKNWRLKVSNFDQELDYCKMNNSHVNTTLRNFTARADNLFEQLENFDLLKRQLQLKPELNIFDAIQASIQELNSSNLKKSHENLLNKSNVSKEFAEINQEFNEIRQLIEMTRRLANEIKYPVQLNDSSLIKLSTSAVSETLRPSLITKISLYLKTKETDAPIALVYNNELLPNQYILLYLKNGRPHVQYKFNNESVFSKELSTDSQVNDNEWYKINFERIGKINIYFYGYQN